MRMPININNVPTEYLLRTKAGKLWRCGKGYRKNWNKLIGKLVLLHNKPYTLINRIKKNSKWYLVFTDGKYNYTEQQTKALHNKKLSRDVIKETDFSKGLFNRLPNGKIVLKERFTKDKNTKDTKQTEQQLLLPAPKELVDRLYEEIIRATIEYNKTSKRKLVTKASRETVLQKCQFISHHSYIMSKPLYYRCKRQILQYYHPDHNSSTTTDFMELLYWIFNRR